MEQPVLKIDGQIQEDDRCKHRQPRRKCKQVEEAPPLFGGDQSNTDGGKGKDQADQQRIQDHDQQVAWPALMARIALRPPHREDLPHSHSKQYEGEDASPNQRLMGGQECVIHFGASKYNTGRQSKWKLAGASVVTGYGLHNTSVTPEDGGEVLRCSLASSLVSCPGMVTSSPLSQCIKFFTFQPECR